MRIKHYRRVKNQKGLSSYGIVLGLAIIGFLLTVVLKILPIYMSNMAIRSTLKSLGENSSFAQMSKGDIVKKLQKDFNLNGINGAPPKSIKVRRRADGWLVNVDYEERVDFIGNIDVVLSFENQLNQAKPEDCCKKLIADEKE